MVHNMKLAPSAFSKIADGSKTIELRLCDEKRQKIGVGDTVIFNCTANSNSITAKVKGLHNFDDFKCLYKTLPLDKCGYAENELGTAHYTDMDKYYTKEQTQKYGALGIELYDVCAICNVKESITDTSVTELLSPSVYNPTKERLLSRTKRYQESKKAKVYAYYENGRSIGIVVFEINEQTATILDIAVKPEHRGKGIGGRLIDFVYNRFEVAQMIAETDDDAIDFYKKCGLYIVNTKVEYGTKRYVCVKK